jgi:hypothetical protein
MYFRNSVVSIPNILAKNSEGGPLLYYRTRAELEGNKQAGLFVSSVATLILNIFISMPD